MRLKLKILFIILFLACPSIISASSIDVNACQDSNYKVMVKDKILSCFTTYDEALKAMNEYDSTIGSVAYIKYNNKIINAKYGIARLNRSNNTTNIFVYNANNVLTRYTYTTAGSGNEALLLDYIYDTREKLHYYKIMLSGVVGYVYENFIDVVPVNSYDEIGTYYYNDNGYLRHRYRTSYNGSFGYAILNLYKSPLYLKAGTRYYSFDGIYFYSDYTKLVDDNKNNIHDNAINKTPYYNYFMYLPVRTTTSALPDDINNYIVNGLNKSNEKITRGERYQFLLKNNTVSIPELEECDAIEDLVQRNVCVNETKYNYSFNEYKKAYIACAGNTSCQNDAKNTILGDWVSYTINGALARPFVLTTSNSIPVGADVCDSTSYNSYSEKIQCLDNLKAAQFPGSYINAPSNGKKTMLANEGSSFIEIQNNKGVNAIISFAVSINESGAGTSYLAITENNLYGIGAYDTDPLANAATYASVKDGINGFGYLISKSYASSTGSYYRGSHLGNKGSGFNVSYASDPYWGEKAAQHYGIFVNSTGVDDFKKYKVGIKNNDLIAPVKLEANNTSKTLYNIATKNAPVIILEVINGEEINGNNIWYKIQTDSPIENGNLSSSAEYNFDTSTAYIHSSYLYVEEEKPVITATNYSMYVGDKVDYKKNVSAYDAWDGDLTSKITYTGTINNNKVGTYNITYKVVDSDNNTTEKVITVNVIENEQNAPVINAINKEVFVGDSVNLLDGVTAIDIEDGDLTSKIKVSPTSIDTSSAKEVEVTYEVSDKNGNITTKKILITVSDKFNIMEGSFGFEKLVLNNNKIDIMGYLTILNINNDLNIDIKYDLVLVNEITNEEFSIKLKRITDKNLIPYDTSDTKYNYTYSWFNDQIDLSNIPEGNYNLYIRARGKGYEAKTIFREIFMKELNNKFDKKIIINGRSYLFRRDYLNNNIPLQLFIRNSGEVGSKLPTIDNMFNSFYTMSFNNNTLNIKGTSHNVGANYSTSVNVYRELILENVDTLERIRYNVGYIDNGDYQVTLNVSDGYDKTRAWFDAKNIDISNLNKGTYAIYLHTNNGVVDDYGELVDIFMKELPKAIKINAKEYVLKRNDSKRFRIELIVK